MSNFNRGGGTKKRTGRRLGEENLKGAKGKVKEEERRTTRSIRMGEKKG